MYVEPTRSLCKIILICFFNILCIYRHNLTVYSTGGDKKRQQTLKGSSCLPLTVIYYLKITLQNQPLQTIHSGKSDTGKEHRIHSHNTGPHTYDVICSKQGETLQSSLSPCVYDGQDVSDVVVSFFYQICFIFPLKNLPDIFIGVVTDLSSLKVLNFQWFCLVFCGDGVGDFGIYYSVPLV